MSQLDPEILRDFQAESKDLVDQMIEILEKCEGDFSQVKSLEQYGLFVDRIMGGAKSLAMSISDKNHIIHQIGDYCAICKAVGYKASQIKDNEHFYDVVVALLLDASEMLPKMLDLVGSNQNLNTVLSKTFVERVKWVSEKFGAEYRSSVEVNKNAPKKMDQGDIDDLLKKLGLD
jgi:hypothetical protein